MTLVIRTTEGNKLNSAILKAFSGYNSYTDEMIELLVNELIHSFDNLYWPNILSARINRNIFDTLKHSQLLLLLSVAINICICLKSHFLLFGNYISKIRISFLQRKQNRADDHSFTDKHTIWYQYKFNATV